MILIKKATDLGKWLNDQQQNGNSIGFVPTMGALHAGHISLVEASRAINTFTVCSIFVNPTQFNDPKDFEKYPVTIEKDIQLLEKAGCDILFLPAVKQMYPDGIVAKMQYNLGHLETVLEGKYRPGHFQGVCTVVHRLLGIVKPNRLYLGQKDYQQCMVITKLVELIGMKEQVEIIICPTIREANGLAMSSRNARLNELERKTAATIYESLLLIKENFRQGNPGILQQKAQSMLQKAGFGVDYVQIADAANLSFVNDPTAIGWDGKQKLIALAAAFINGVRLIDNMVIN